MKNELTKEWCFKRFGVISNNVEIGQILENAVVETLENAGTFFRYNELQKDETIDNLLMIENRNIKSNLYSFYKDLELFKVADLIQNDGVKYVLSSVKQLAEFINNNSFKPNKIANKINAFLKETTIDNSGVEVVYHVLCLQGVLKWLEDSYSDESDYLHIKSSFDTVTEIYIQRLVTFIYFPWCTPDIEYLKPITNYLYSTEIGKAVQESIFKDQNQTVESVSIPEELDTPEARKIFDKAIDAGLIKRSDKLNAVYMWQDEKQLLAYFAEKMSLRFNLGKIRNGEQTINWIIFQSIFNVSNLKGAKYDDMKDKFKFSPPGYEIVDKLFE